MRKERIASGLGRDEPGTYLAGCGFLCTYWRAVRLLSTYSERCGMHHSHPCQVLWRTCERADLILVQGSRNQRISRKIVTYYITNIRKLEKREYHSVVVAMV